MSYDILAEFYHEASGRPVLTGNAIAHQTFGYQLRFYPHFHAGCMAEQQFARIATRPIVLEGGFDEEGTFFYIPFSRLQWMTELFRRRFIKLLVGEELLNEDFARNLLSWKHSGFKIDNSVHILDESSQESLVEYIARPPISLKKIRYEPFKGRVLFHTTYSEYFRENVHLFDALDFLSELTRDAGLSSKPGLRPGQHIPPKRLQLIRLYGLCASRTKGRWARLFLVPGR